MDILELMNEAYKGIEKDIGVKYQEAIQIGEAKCSFIHKSDGTIMTEDGNIIPEKEASQIRGRMELGFYVPLKQK